MEGNKLTGERTSMIYVIETGNHFRLFDYMINDCDEPLTISMIYKFHEILKTGITDFSLD